MAFFEKSHQKNVMGAFSFSRPRHRASRGVRAHKIGKGKVLSLGNASCGFGPDRGIASASADVAYGLMLVNAGANFAVICQ
jgi:hypothetical protein